MINMLFNQLPTKARKYVTEGIRKAFKYTTRREYLYEARVELPRRTKTGKISLVPDVYYRCAGCDTLFKEKEVHVDHIDPVIPLNSKLLDMDVSTYTQNVFNNLCQTLCVFCHRQKTTSENKKRKHK